MKTNKTIALGVLALMIAGPSLACPALSAYRVQGISAKTTTPAGAVALLLEGTAWKAEVDPALDAPITLRGVSGPLDRVLERVIEGLNSDGQISMLQDAATCVVRVSLRRPAPQPEAVSEVSLAAAPAPTGAQYGDRVIELDPFAEPVALGAPSVPATRSHILPAGTRLSEALAAYVEQRDWSMRWMLEDDYVLDVDVPVPPLDVIDGVTWVVTAYQAQGGLRGVTPRFATPNRVVVIEAMNVREDVR